MNNIEPWCISRQLWWGHRLPIYYTDDNHVIAAESEEEARKIANDKYSYVGKLTQDNNVLDTWFSSALW